jgi:acyl-coenzyme A thioesterase PaaI-like protein
MNQMPDPKSHVDEAEVKSFVSALPFVQEFSITITSVVPGQVTIELPFDERFSGPPGQFPASIVGVAGDVAAVASCLSLLPRTNSVGAADVFIVSVDREILCGSVLATTRNFQVISDSRPSIADNA